MYLEYEIWSSLDRGRDFCYFDDVINQGDSFDPDKSCFATFCIAVREWYCVFVVLTSSCSSDYIMVLAFVVFLATVGAYLNNKFVEKFGHVIVVKSPRDIFKLFLAGTILTSAGLLTSIGGVVNTATTVVDIWQSANNWPNLHFVLRRRKVRDWLFVGERVSE